MASTAGRRFRSTGSIAHVWEGGDVTAFTPNQEFDELRMREGTPAERKAWLAEAVRAGLLEDITDDQKAGTR